MRHPPRLVVAAQIGLLGLSLAGADETIINSKHDLSAFGPGRVRALEAQEICIFCHTPHNARPQTPLWNRYNPTTYYRIYSSSTTDARIDQPGGPSKMCLSCHDGSIALGLVLSRPPTDPIPMNQLYMPSGPGDLTNDLSDDHPIGLRYDRQLTNRDPQIRPPELISRDIKLGPHGELECVACHDPHNNELGNFLRMPARQGVICVTCHQMAGWRTSSHGLSASNVPLSVTGGEQLAYLSMYDNACLSCHKVHAAPQRERLLRSRPYELCVACHDGLSARGITAARGSRSGHRVDRLLSRHDPAEDPFTMPPHVDCTDCHNPHAARPNPLGGSPPVPGGRGPGVPPALEHVPGVTLSGGRAPRAKLYYEVCFRCHGDNPVPVPGRIVRGRDEGGNLRRLFLPTAASAHPVTFAAGLPDEVPSLLPELRARPLLSCQDCHSNPDARQFGGSAPNGPHGSRFESLLVDRYEVADFTSESPQAYALCYRCHDRNSILSDESFPLHQRHVARGRSPCSACHSPHGVSGSRAQGAHLINFDLSIVSGERFYNDTGRFAGTCTLTCHGVRHVNFTYGP